MPVVRWQRSMTWRRLASWLGLSVLGLVPALAEARTPLPTIEVVQPPRRPRLLDVRWSLQTGGGFELGQRVPVLAIGQVAHISFVELGRATQLHAALGSTGFVDLSRGWARRRAMFGADLGLGLSRHVPGGPALVATVTAGPRWVGTPSPMPDDREARALQRWRVDGWGVIGQVDAYPWYASVPEIIDGKLGWFRRHVLSGLHVWAAVRYDVLRTGARTPTYLGGAGFDLGRTVVLPLLMRPR